MEQAEIQQLAEVREPAERAKRAGEIAGRLQAAITEVSRIRREALDELVSAGKTQAEIADLLGMTRSRVGQLLSSGPRPERALLGSGTLAVAVGGKWEAGKENPGAVVSAPAFAAYETLSTLARTLGLSTEYEVVPPPGLVQLNRGNLIVLSSPRLLPLVGQVLDADPHLGFRSDDKGWYLVDKTAGETYRSPSDHGECRDYAYVGRLPRPDGKGSFLYLAGIHAMGTLGAAHWLASNLDTLYKEVKTRRWSALVECSYDDEGRTVTSTSRVSPVYRHEGAP